MFGFGVGSLIQHFSKINPGNQLSTYHNTDHKNRARSKQKEAWSGQSDYIIMNHSASLINSYTFYNDQANALQAMTITSNWWVRSHPSRLKQKLLLIINTSYNKVLTQKISNQFQFHTVSMRSVIILTFNGDQLLLIIFIFNIVHAWKVNQVQLSNNNQRTHFHYLSAFVHDTRYSRNEISCLLSDLCRFIVQPPKDCSTDLW